jgi:hypothetical protein
MLHISPNRHIHEVQQEFNAIFPFLRLDFYKLQEADPHLLVKKHINNSNPLKSAGLKKSGWLAVSENMTVSELEKQLHHDYGLEAQVSRQSGILWLETTMTDNWTLRQQNDHGKEITLGKQKNTINGDDYDLQRDADH